MPPKCHKRWLAVLLTRSILPGLVTFAHIVFVGVLRREARSGDSVTAAPAPAPAMSRMNKSSLGQFIKSKYISVFVRARAIWSGPHTSWHTSWIKFCILETFATQRILLYELHGPYSFRNNYEDLIKRNHLPCNELLSHMHTQCFTVFSIVFPSNLSWFDKLIFLSNCFWLCIVWDCGPGDATVPRTRLRITGGGQRWEEDQL